MGCRFLLGPEGITILPQAWFSHNFTKLPITSCKTTLPSTSHLQIDHCVLYKVGFPDHPYFICYGEKNQNIHSVPNVTSHFSLLRNKDNYFLSKVPKGTICGLKVGFHFRVQSFVCYKGKM